MVWPTATEICPFLYFATDLRALLSCATLNMAHFRAPGTCVTLNNPCDDLRFLLCQPKSQTGTLRQITQNCHLMHQDIVTIIIKNFTKSVKNILLILIENAQQTAKARIHCRVPGTGACIPQILMAGTLPGHLMAQLTTDHTQSGRQNKITKPGAFPMLPQISG